MFIRVIMSALAALEGQTMQSAMRTFAATIILAIACGCASSAARHFVRHALVDDVTARPPLLADYCVVAVDGKPVNRLSCPYIPVAELEPGIHTLTLRLAEAEGRQSTVTADFQAGKNYHVKSEDGSLSIVEAATPAGDR